MSRSTDTPPALKVFACSLVGAVLGSYGAYRLADYLILRFFPRLDPMLVVLALFLAPLAIGVASAVTAGVLAGKSARS